jgi:hypothetical protein
MAEEEDTVESLRGSSGSSSKECGPGVSANSETCNKSPFAESVIVDDSINPGKSSKLSSSFSLFVASKDMTSRSLTMPFK